MAIHLSPRETEVATMTANGMTKEYIAYLLGICPGTVEIYRRRIREKLEAHTMVEAIAKCVNAGIIVIKN